MEEVTRLHQPDTSYTISYLDEKAVVNAHQSLMLSRMPKKRRQITQEQELYL
ncbi:hypothetical protein [Salmonella enterica]|uniref:hypothetical protein n=1 Tax=Salmonella enterica TaxID=28901 RepID=UPI00193D09C5|nr:hypothetical protein [Salmonella enterica]